MLKPNLCTAFKNCYSFLTVCHSVFGAGWSLPWRVSLPLERRKPHCPHLLTHSVITLSYTAPFVEKSSLDQITSLTNVSSVLTMMLIPLVLNVRAFNSLGHGPVGLLPLWRRQLKEKLFVSLTVGQCLFKLAHFTTIIGLNLD